jgi:PilZ domain-containing protein
MESRHSIFRQPVPVDKRSPLKERCILHFSNCDTDTYTFNISFLGLGVELPQHSESFELSTLQSVTVPEIGKFEVRVAWCKRNRMGLIFKSKKSARSDIQMYFEKTRKRLL